MITEREIKYIATRIRDESLDYTKANELCNKLQTVLHNKFRNVKSLADINTALASLEDCVADVLVSSGYPVFSLPTNVLAALLLVTPPVIEQLANIMPVETQEELIELSKAGGNCYCDSVLLRIHEYKAGEYDIDVLSSILPELSYEEVCVLIDMSEASIKNCESVDEVKDLVHHYIYRGDMG